MIFFLFIMKIDEILVSYACMWETFQLNNIGSLAKDSIKHADDGK